MAKVIKKATPVAAKKATTKEEAPKKSAVVKKETKKEEPKKVVATKTATKKPVVKAKETPAPATKKPSIAKKDKQTTAKKRSIAKTGVIGGGRMKTNYEIKVGGQATQEAYIAKLWEKINSNPVLRPKNTPEISKKAVAEFMKLNSQVLAEVTAIASFRDTVAGIYYANRYIESRVTQPPKAADGLQTLVLGHREVKVRKLIETDAQMKFFGQLSDDDDNIFVTSDGDEINIEEATEELNSLKPSKKEKEAPKKEKASKVEKKAPAKKSKKVEAEEEDEDEDVEVEDEDEEEETEDVEEDEVDEEETEDDEEESEDEDEDDWDEDESEDDDEE